MHLCSRGLSASTKKHRSLITLVLSVPTPSNRLCCGLRVIRVRGPGQGCQQSFGRYEVYKKAETVAEAGMYRGKPGFLTCLNKALSLGCKKGDLLHDQSKGYLIIAQA